MLILLAASIFSWTYILQRNFYLSDAKKEVKNFEQTFWAGEDLAKLYTEGNKRKASLKGIEAIRLFPSV